MGAESKDASQSNENASLCNKAHRMLVSALTKSRCNFPPNAQRVMLPPSAIPLVSVAIDRAPKVFLDLLLSPERRLVAISLNVSERLSPGLKSISSK